MVGQEQLQVIMCAAESVPFVKVGGLGDMVGSLSKALGQFGVRVSIILPAYKSIHHEQYGLHRSPNLPQFSIPFGADLLPVEVFQSRMPGTEIEVYFLRCGQYFDREGIYDDPGTREGYTDNMQRFVAFMKAAIQLSPRLGAPPDIFHCHDLHTGLIPALLRINHKEDPFWSHTGILFTLHNLAYQGVYPKESLYWAGIDSSHFYPGSAFEYWGQTNFLKAGIEYADSLNTVSRAYASEIQSGAEFGHGLEGLLRRREADLTGIVNGIDCEVWNPETDLFIPAHFSQRDLSGKSVCKAEVQRAFGLPQVGPRTPLIGILSRLVDQKGFDLIQDAISELTHCNLQLAVLGIGQQKYQDLFKDIARSCPEKISARFEFDNRLAHLIEAGCDMFLMPSRFEPCGLNQLYSLRYGTVPVVRATGGLADTVIDYNPTTQEGTGFTFISYSARAMMESLRRALDAYADPQCWHGIMLRGMDQDWSWVVPARKYLQLYEEISRRKRLQVSHTPSFLKTRSETPEE
jgi:starch synthase